MRLSDISQGRDNNYKLIRIVAALAVLVSHSFYLTVGVYSAEPLYASLGRTLGQFAVDIFFITSGFLVSSSLMKKQSTVEYLRARVLRIFPALWVMLLLTVFLLGLSFTSLSIPDYLSSPEIYNYLLRCTTLFAGTSNVLPGVFNNNLVKDCINNPLWTLPYEIRMYAILLFVWLVLKFTPKFRLKAFKTVVIIFASVAGVYMLSRYLSYYIFQSYVVSPFSTNSIRLFCMFFYGASFYVLRRHIVLSSRVFWLFAISLLLAALNKQVFFVVYILVIGYILLFIAYIPDGIIRKYNRFGDYSYGVYIYAFPVQQSVAALIPGVSTLQMIVNSFVLTIFLAILSWHLLEKKALNLKTYQFGGPK